jgi:hypothetical protein
MLACVGRNGAEVDVRDSYRYELRRKPRQEGIMGVIFVKRRQIVGLLPVLETCDD